MEDLRTKKAALKEPVGSIIDATGIVNIRHSNCGHYLKLHRI